MIAVDLDVQPPITPLGVELSFWGGEGRRAKRDTFSSSRARAHKTMPTLLALPMCDLSGWTREYRPIYTVENVNIIFIFTSSLGTINQFYRLQHVDVLRRTMHWARQQSQKTKAISLTLLQYGKYDAAAPHYLDIPKANSCASTDDCASPVRSCAVRALLLYRSNLRLFH